MVSRTTIASTSRVDTSVGHTTSRNRSPSSGAASAEIHCSSRNPSLNCRTLMVRRKLSSEVLRRTYPSSSNVSSSRRTVVRCRPLSSASSPTLAPPSSLFNIFNNIRPRVKPRTVLYSVCSLFCILIDIYIVKTTLCTWCTFGHVLIVAENTLPILSAQ